VALVVLTEIPEPLMVVDGHQVAAAVSMVQVAVLDVMR
jgi:hypothetical protein